MRSPDDATVLLSRAQGGDADARDRFVGLLYGELRRVAQGHRRRLGAGDTVNTTALVHEAFEKLAGQSVVWADRRHYLGFAGRAMRDVLVDYARAQGAAKRGGPGSPLSLAGFEDAVPAEEPTVRVDEVLALDGALDRLAVVHPDAARVVELRYFAGLSLDETAEVLGVSEKTVRRRWIVARAWLHAALSETDSPGGDGEITAA
ncbi:MAG TPA: ECF-type sigma factor [Rubricoccaceae bacterium]